MDLDTALKHYVLPILTIALFVIDRVKQTRKAKESETELRHELSRSYEHRVRETREQYQSRVDFLQEQLDTCLDASRPTRPDKLG